MKQTADRIEEAPSILRRASGLHFVAETKELFLRLERFATDDLNHGIDPLRIGIESKAHNAACAQTTTTLRDQLHNAHCATEAYGDDIYTGNPCSRSVLPFHCVCPFRLATPCPTESPHCNRR